MITLPNNLKKLTSIQGKVQVVRRFITQMVNKITSYSHLIKKETKFIWVAKYQGAFEDIKRFLLNPPILSPVDPSRPSYLYIFATQHALGVMLAQTIDDGKERAIYYISKELLKHEIRKRCVML